VKLRLAAVVLTAAALAGCAGAGAGGVGRATVWVTRDEGAHVLLVRTVPAGLTAMQGLQRVARVKTRYDGRFVQAIDGVAGSLSRRQDWFYFLNGYEADRGAAEYRLRDGDVEWWDYRSWKHAIHIPVVVGAFPEPFLHGYNGKRRPAVVVDVFCSQQVAARRLARMLHGRATCHPGDGLRPRWNALVLTKAPNIRLFDADQRSGSGAGDPVRFRFIGPAMRLANNPQLARFHYSLLTP
jgi:hypothetical protein